MYQRYTTALKLSLLIVVVFSFVAGAAFYVYSGSLTPLQKAWPHILFSQGVLLLFSCVIIQMRIENFILTKVKSLYQELLPTGIPLKEDSLQKDVLSITQNLQEFAKENKLEIEILKGKESYRREFIGNLAHELKTPLFTVQGFILTLLENDIQDKKTIKKYLKKAAKGVDRLDFIIKDLDVITQFETGATTLNIEQFDVAALIQEIVEMLEIRAGKSGVNLQSSRVYSSPVMVSGDRERITQVLTNLVVNSFKYGVENGTTEIEVEALNAAKILVRVIDNGKGIAEEHLPRLFERFYRVDKTRNRNEGGSGLGLAIVKHIIEAHNENIFVESTPNVGSEFSFTLSRAEA